MIVSRCLTAARLSSNLARNSLLQNGKISLRKQVVRHSHGEVKYYYRSSPNEGRHDGKIFEALGAVVWWWVLWHLFTDYHELMPHAVPDPSKWTDEELGIPPIDS